MNKIPTLFVRDPENMSRVTREVTPGCEWVLAGEGVATRKWDGTNVLVEVRDGRCFAMIAETLTAHGYPVDIKSTPPMFLNDAVHNALAAKNREMATAHARIRVLEEALAGIIPAINAAAEADMLAGNPVTGAHHRAIESVGVAHVAAALSPDPEVKP